MTRRNNSLSFVKRWFSVLFVCWWKNHLYQSKSGVTLYFCRRCGRFDKRILTYGSASIRPDITDLPEGH